MRPGHSLGGVLAAATIRAAQTAAPVAVTRPVAPGAIASHPESPAARPEDVVSPQAIIAAMSDAISSDGTKPRLDAGTELILPGAGRLILRVAKDGVADVAVLSLDDWRRVAFRWQALLGSRVPMGYRAAQ